MKTRLLKKEQILSLIILICCGAQYIKAQSASSDNTSSMQSFQLIFNSVDGPTTTRELELSFSDHTSDNFEEEYDTKNLELMYDDLNLILNGEFFTSQAYSSITEDKVVDLVFQASGNYNYTIKLNGMENMGNRNIELKDNLLDTTFDLRGGGTYEFSSVNGYFPNRFQITFKTTTLSQTDFDIDSIAMRYVNDNNTILVLNPTNQSVRGIEMFSITGKQVYSSSTLNNSNSIAYKVKNLNTGIYILKLETENNGLITKKVLVK
jgi:hypothetical protein